MRIIIWQNIPSMHQSAFVRALAQTHEVTFAYEEDLPTGRKKMGWIMPNFGNAELLDVRDPLARRRLASEQGADAIHVFGCYFNLAIASAILNDLRHSPAKRVWVSEAFDSKGWRGAVRSTRAWWRGICGDRTVFHRIFAMGDLGTTFFRKVGFPGERLREFAYSVDETTSDSEAPRSPNASFRIVYVGQLIRRKGVDVLLAALASLTDPRNWELDIIGDGEDRTALKVQAESAGLKGRIAFLGNKDNKAARVAMAGADCLVLPSRWDGWGAVVNEALLGGTPVIVSDRCGAASLISTFLHGEVFKSENSADLARCLSRRLSAVSSPSSRSSISRWANATITGQRLAEYFVSQLSENANGPSLPPWKEAPQP